MEVIKIARFYGEMMGKPPRTVTRQGYKADGMWAHIRGWDMGVNVRMFVNEDGNDELVINLTGGSNNPNQLEFIFQDEHGKERIVKSDKEFRVRLPSDFNIRLNLDN